VNVSLTPELESFVQKQVSGGLYQTASEVIRAGLRRLKEDQQQRLPAGPRTREELEAELLQSIEALESGQGVDGKEVLRRLRQRIKGTRASG
jgi:antitoxin ParD1/3/4